MSNLSSYGQNKLLDHILRTAAWAKPAGLYIALFTATPAGAPWVEVAAGGYARVAAGPGDTIWTATQGGAVATTPSSGTSGTSSNVSDIAFPSPTANWGTVIAFGLMDASVAGNMIIGAPLATARTIVNGAPAPTFRAGTLIITA